MSSAEAAAHHLDVSSASTASNAGGICSSNVDPAPVAPVPVAPSLTAPVSSCIAAEPDGASSATCSTADENPKLAEALSLAEHISFNDMLKRLNMPELKRTSFIGKTEERGITLRQLRAVWDHIEARCVKDGWLGGPNRDKKLTPKQVTLYDVDYYIIRPATARWQCSFVELVARKAQRPKWFVSHWWGEPVFEFIECIAAHRRDHNLSEDDPYWVCAYANNQWNLAAELGDEEDASNNDDTVVTTGDVTLVATGNHGDTNTTTALTTTTTTNTTTPATAIATDPSSTPAPAPARVRRGSATNDPDKTSFHRALDIANGTLSILDPGGVVFSRIWCVYEVHVSFKKRDIQWAVYTSRANYGGVGLTQSIAPRDVSVDGRPDMRAKVDRERLFPLKIAHKALGIDLQQAQSSVPEDRVRILNRMMHPDDQDADLDAMPDESDLPAVKKLNRELRARFAAGVLRRAIDQQGYLEARLGSGSKRVVELMDALAAGELQELHLDFRGCRNFTNSIASSLLMHKMPSGLRELVVGVDAHTQRVLLKAVTSADWSNRIVSLDTRECDFHGKQAHFMASVVLSKPQMELFGEVPVKGIRSCTLTSVDLLGKRLGVTEALVIAALLRARNALTKLKLGVNAMCGLDENGNGAYRMEGIAAIADALQHSSQLVHLDLRWNHISERDKTDLRKKQGPQLAELLL